MKKLTLLFAVLLVIGCAQVREHVDYVKLCLQDPACRAEAQESAKQGKEVGAIAGASVPVPGGAAAGALLGYGSVLLFSLWKGGKKKNEETHPTV